MTKDEFKIAIFEIEACIFFLNIPTPPVYASFLIKNEFRKRTSAASDQKTPPYPPAISLIFEKTLLNINLKSGELKYS